MVYTAKRADQVPLSFGYHEAFHPFIVLGAAPHYATILRLLLSWRASPVVAQLGSETSRALRTGRTGPLALFCAGTLPLLRRLRVNERLRP